MTVDCPLMCFVIGKYLVLLMAINDPVLELTGVVCVRGCGVVIPLKKKSTSLFSKNVALKGSEEIHKVVLFFFYHNDWTEL